MRPQSWHNINCPHRSDQLPSLPPSPAVPSPCSSPVSSPGQSSWRPAQPWGKSPSTTLLIISRSCLASTTCPQCCWVPAGSFLNLLTRRTQALQISPPLDSDRRKHLLKNSSYLLLPVNLELLDLAWRWDSQTILLPYCPCLTCLADTTTSAGPVDWSFVKWRHWTRDWAVQVVFWKFHQS